MNQITAYELVRGATLALLALTLAVAHARHVLRGTPYERPLSRATVALVGALTYSMCCFAAVAN